MIPTKNTTQYCTMQNNIAHQPCRVADIPFRIYIF